MPYTYQGVEISWLGHAAFLLKHSGKLIYIDPYKIRSKGSADIILVTHEHFDHLSPNDLRKIVKHDTDIVAPRSCEGKLKGLGAGIIKLIKPGDKVTVRDVEVEAIPAYNLTKFRAPGIPYHPREAGGVGYILNLDGVRIYHAGDTDFIPEMRELKVDVALIPVSGTYVMTAEEAAEAVNTFKPKLAIPMHYGSIVGSRRDAERFKELAEVEVVILERE
ncbi:MAG: MBL fold metallo-hydrolase [Thaumarchaeota archaeon]|nr:MAG: MBL fold metallo-hydrolase [Nitrososphaerota archaeon]